MLLSDRIDALVRQPSERAIADVLDPEAVIIGDQSLLHGVEGRRALLSLFIALQPAQKAGTTVHRNDRRTLVVMPATLDDPYSRKVLVLTHLGDFVIEAVWTTDVAALDATQSPGAAQVSSIARFSTNNNPLPEVEPRRVFITASSSGLGAALARAFAIDGAAVVVHAHRDLRGGSLLAADLLELGARSASVVTGDLTQPAEVERATANAAEALGGAITVLVNNFGPWDNTRVSAASPERWQRSINAHLSSVQTAAKVVAPGMIETGYGRIINIGAGSGWVRNHGLYSFFKSSLSLLTEHLALELGPQITVNVIAPGQIEESAEAMNAIDPAAVANAIKNSPAGRLVRQSEIASAVVALCAPAFSMLTGATIPVDGGSRLAQG